MPARAQLEWTHDIAIGNIQLIYPGAESSFTGRYYTVKAGTPVTVDVVVQNNSRNPAVAFELELTDNGAIVEKKPQGGSLRSGEQRHYRLNWVAQPGEHVLRAQIKFTKSLPGGDPLESCKECQRSSKCSWPASVAGPENRVRRYCRNGAGEAVHSCHNLNDNPDNNVGAVGALGEGTASNPANQPPPQADVPDLPDLAISTANARDLSQYKGRGRYLVTVTVVNRGKKAHTGSIPVLVTMGRGTKYRVTISGGLAPGESKTGSVEVTVSGSPAFSATVDADNRIKEIDERNNDWR